jgi:hypothetical protein
MTRGQRWLLAVVLLVLGLVVGVVGAFVQAQRATLEGSWGSLALPWGVLVVWIALVAAIRGGAWWMRSRWGGWAVLLGWLTATVALSTESPSGDVALSGGGRQLTYLLGGVILASAAASLPVPLPRGGTPVVPHSSDTAGPAYDPVDGAGAAGLD